MALAIREYRESDRDAVIRCNTYLHNVERSIEPDRRKGEEVSERYIDERVMGFGGAREGKIYVAEIKDSVIGFTSVWIEHLTDGDELTSSLTPYAYVSDIVVMPEHQGKGIGKLLLARAERYARDKKMPVIKLTSLTRNTKAMDVYRRAGYREHEVMMLKYL